MQTFPKASPKPARPWWAALLAGFCGVTLVFLIARDLIVPDARKVEVWLGFEVTGRAALLTAPMHWAVYAVGAWGFWYSRRWVWPWASVYVFYIALSHLVWNLISASGGGLSSGLTQLLVFSIAGIVLLWARPALLRA